VHFLTSSLYLLWYQQMWSSEENLGVSDGDSRLGCLPGVLLLALVSVVTVACSLVSPARSCSNCWEVSVGESIAATCSGGDIVGATVATVGAATSTTRSAM